MATLPWQNVSNSDPSKKYVAMLTYLPLKHYRTTSRFFIYISRIRKQLSKTSGLVSFSMRAHPASKDYWTLSVWENDAAISQFVSTPPHVNVMKKMTSAMGKTKFTSWTIKGGHLPLVWSDAIKKQL